MQCIVEQSACLESAKPCLKNMTKSLNMQLVLKFHQWGPDLPTKSLGRKILWQVKQPESLLDKLQKLEILNTKVNVNTCYLSEL